MTKHSSGQDNFFFGGVIGTNPFNGGPHIDPLPGHGHGGGVIDPPPPGLEHYYDAMGFDFGAAHGHDFGGLAF